MSGAEEVLVNMHGQKMGRKGRLTRQRIMDVTLQMLENSSYKDLTVADVAYEAEVSSSTFYVYFEDIEDVLFECVKAAALDLGELYEVLNEEWTQDNLESHVQRFVSLYTELWEKYRVELRIRNLEADQGNLRFLNIRVETTKGIIQALAKKIGQLNPNLKNSEQMAVIIHAAMSSIAAQHDIGITAGLRQTRKQLSAGIVELICTVLRGNNSPKK